jgi:hypothetical protein
VSCGRGHAAFSLPRRFKFGPICNGVQSRSGQVNCPGRSWPNHKPGPSPGALNIQRADRTVASNSKAPAAAASRGPARSRLGPGRLRAAAALRRASAGPSRASPGRDAPSPTRRLESLGPGPRTRRIAPGWTEETSASASALRVERAQRAAPGARPTSTDSARAVVGLQLGP